MTHPLCLTRRFVTATVVFAVLLLAAGRVHAGEETREALEARLLAGLLSPDEEARAAASREMEELRIQDHEGESGPRSWPGEDEAEAARPKTPYEQMKFRIFDGLLESLKQAEPPARLAAARSLGGLTPVTNAVVDGLAAALEDPDAEVRLALLAALSRIRPVWPGGPRVQEQLPAIVARIDDDDPRVAAEALRMASRLIRPLGWYEESRADALARGRRRLDDEDAAVRAAALGLLGELLWSARDDLTPYVEALADPSPAVRVMALHLLGRRGARAGVARDVIRARLEDAEFNVRYAAAGAVWSVGGGSEGVVEVLIEALGRLEGNDVVGPAAILAEIGPSAEAAAPALIRVLGEVEYQRFFASGDEVLQALWSIGPSEGIARPAIEKALADGKDPAQVALALSSVHGDPARVAARLLELRAGTEDPRILAATARALGIVGHAGEDVLAVLRLDLASGDQGRSNAAADAAKRLGPAAHALQADLARALGEATELWPRVFLAAALAAVRANDALLGLLSDPVLFPIAVEGLAPPAPDALPVLREMRKTAGAAEQVDLLDAIRRLGGDPEPLIPMLVPLLDHADEGVREAAALALGRFGPLAAEHRPRLERLAKDGNRWGDGAAAALAVWQVGGPPEPALAHLLNALQTSHPPQVQTIGELAAMGPLAAPAVPALMDAALGGRQAFRRDGSQTEAAIEALGRIGPGAAAALPLLRELERNRLFAPAATAAIARIEKR